jgi:pimeloyl-ACP methyl ester carboxylesterase
VPERRGPRVAAVLVHGAWHGAWCWQLVAPELAARGVLPLALDLPGHGLRARFAPGCAHWSRDPERVASDPSPQSDISLDEYAEAVLGALSCARAAGCERVALVGHSMGGIAITAAAERAPGEVSQLVYLAAFMSAPGVAMLEYIRSPENADEQVRALVRAPPEQVGVLRIDPRNPDPAYRAQLKTAFYHDVDDARFAAAAHLLTPDVPLRPVLAAATATLPNWGRIPRAYLRCSEDRAILPALQDRFIREADAWTGTNRTAVRTLKSSHSPFLSDPAALASELAALLQ